MEFKLISIASMIAFYGCYFLKMFHQKKQGIQTDQIGKDKIGFVKFVEITMKIAAILVFIAGLVSIFLETVSYTHLDVYKRQPLRCTRWRFR